jgi:hypothetical protein
MDARQKKYMRQKAVGRIRKWFWTLVTLAGTLALLGFLIKWMIPWFQHLGETL